MCLHAHSLRRGGRTTGVGDDQNSLILLTVKAAFGPGAPKVTIPAARLAQFDENRKLKKEQVVFFALQD